MQSRNNAIVAILLLLCCVMVAVAAPSGERRNRSRKSGEAAAMERLLAKWDLNGDGKLDAYELAQIRKASKQMPKKPKVPRSVERRAILREKYGSATATGATGTEQTTSISKQ